MRVPAHYLMDRDRKEQLLELIMGLAFISLLLLACLMIVGCAAKVPATSTTPGRPGTAFEQVLAWNAALANANLGVAQGVIAASNAGQIAVDATNTILTAQSKIADDDRQFTAILALGPAALKGRSADITRQLNEIQLAAQPLVTGGDLGIKNPSTQQQVLSQLNTIVRFAQQILASLTQLKLLAESRLPQRSILPTGLDRWRPLWQPGNSTNAAAFV